MNATTGPAANARVDEIRWDEEVVLRGILEAAPDAIIVATNEGLIAHANARCEAMFGYLRHELIGQPVEMLIPDRRVSARPDRGNDFRTAPPVLATGALSETYGRHRDGHKFVVGLAVRRLATSGGSIAAFFVRDAAQPYKAEPAESEPRDLAAALRETAFALGSTLHFDGVLDSILVNASRLMPYDAAEVVLLDGEQDVARVVRSTGNSAVGAGTAILSAQPNVSRTPVLRRMIETGGPLILPDVRSEPDWLPVPETHWVRSFAGVPIRICGQTSGFLNLASAAPGFFQHAHAARLQAFAAQVAIAIENARLFEAEREQSILAEALRDTAASLAASLSFDEVLNRILAQAGRVVPHDAAIVWLVDDSLETARIAGYRDYEGGSPPTATLHMASAGDLRFMAESGRPLVVPDTNDHEGWVLSPVLRWVRSLAGVPIRAHDRVIGFLNLYSSVPGFFTPTHAERLQAFASQAAVAIENANLFLAVQQHAAELERRVAERTAELERARARMQAILDAAGEGILFADMDWTIEYANPALEQLTGHSAAEMTGQSPEMWRSDLAPRPTYDEMKAAIQNGAIWQGELVNRRKGGDPYDAALTVSPYRDADGHIIGLVVILRDITRQKELERLKNQFISNVSHELRTPLANVKLYISLLERGRSEKRDLYMQTLHRETTRLQRLIEDLLDLSRLDMGTVKIDLVPVELNRIAADLIADRSAMVAERNLALDYEPEPGLPLCLADAAMMGQVMSNLMANAVNYTQPGGAITLRTATRDRDGRRWVTLSVQDNGPGISEADRLRLFERFYRGEAGRNSGAPGTGLGLAICLEIARRLAGDLTVESQPGHGSTFTIWLPPLEPA